MNYDSYSIIKQELMVAESFSEDSEDFSKVWPTVRKALESWEDKYSATYAVQGGLMGGIDIAGRYMIGGLSYTDSAIKGGLYSHISFKVATDTAETAPFNSELQLTEYLCSDVMPHVIQKELTRLKNSTSFDGIDDLLYYDGPSNVTTLQEMIDTIEIEFNSPTARHLYSGNFSLKVIFLMPVHGVYVYE